MFKQDRKSGILQFVETMRRNANKIRQNVKSIKLTYV